MIPKINSATVTKISSAVIIAIISGYIGNDLIPFETLKSLLMTRTSLGLALILSLILFAALHFTYKPKDQQTNEPDFSIVERKNLHLFHGDIYGVLESVQSEIRFSGIDCKKLLEAESKEIEKLLQSRKKVSVILLDPASADSELLTISDRFANRKEYDDSIQSVLEKATTFTEKYPGYFELRLLPMLPALNFLLIDPARNDSIKKAEIYTFEPYGPIDSRPHIFFSGKENKWNEYLIQQWDNYWKISKPLVVKKSVAV